MTVSRNSSIPILRARGALTILPTSWAMRVESTALRNDIITSARGQSHPVFRLILKKTTDTFGSEFMSAGDRYLTFSVPTSISVPS